MAVQLEKMTVHQELLLEMLKDFKQYAEGIIFHISYLRELLWALYATTGLFRGTTILMLF